MKGFIDENVLYGGNSESDEELVRTSDLTRNLKLPSVEATDNKTKPGGGFFRILQHNNV
jgi:hypothetical protein